MINDQKSKITDTIAVDNCTMYEDAIKAKDPSKVDVYLEGTVSMLENLRGLVSLKVNNHAIVKANTNFSCLKDVSMIDLKLDTYGPLEDQVYALFPLLIKNIRRGNTVLRLDNAKPGEEFVFGRKGLEKFFDLRYEFISQELRYQKGVMDVDLHMQKNYILAGPLKAILSGHKIEVLKTLKANGENFQVSWNHTVQAWVVCSKNVALLCQNREQISDSVYANPRYSFAREMANVWLDKVEALKKERGDAAIDELKSDLDGNTLIGEYIGSQEHQHLVKYSRVTCIFYAVVANNSFEDCWPCEKAWKLFDKWGLDKVAIKTLGSFDDYDQMCDSLCRVFKDVAKSEIAQEEEGNVLYFVKRGSGTTAGQETPDDGEVLSLCKLKTLEYRLFRKMREKLRNYYARDKSAINEYEEGKVIKKFASEARELSEEHELPRPLKYYIQLFRTAFEFLDESNLNVDLLNSEYVTFSEKLLEYFTAKHKEETFAQNSNFFYSPILDVQNSITYGKGEIEKFQLTSKVEDEEVKRAHDDYDEEEEVKGESAAGAAAGASKRANQYDELSENLKPIKRQRVEKTPVAASDKNVIVCIIPFSLPCSGKSFIWDALK